ncbi:LUD domain-containing protein [Anaerolineales bacterium]
MTSRNQILNQLRTNQTPFDLPSASPHPPVVPLEDLSAEALIEQFLKSAEAVLAKTYRVKTESEVYPILETLIGDDNEILSWDPKWMPKHYAEWLERQSLKTSVNNDQLRVGITSCDAALAATGSLVLIAGQGKPRAVSLLPELHIAIVKASQLVPDLETWIASAAPHFQDASNIVLITGPSKTADIAQILILGAHGPRELHIILLE